MKPNRENYGIFIIDYFDGNLSEAEKEQLLLFLDANPDLKKEFKNLDQATLEKPDISFPEKEKLKVPVIKPTSLINKDNYESFFVLFHDGELKTDEAKDLKQFLDINPHLSNELELFGKIRLEKDKQVVYPDKAALKHKKPVTIQLASALTIAAMLLIYFGFRFLLPSESNTPVTKQNYRIAALEIVPSMTLGASVVNDEPLRLKSQPKHLIPLTKKIIARKQAPVQMLASLSLPAHFDNYNQGKTILAGSKKISGPKAGQPHPVVVEEDHRSLLASAANPINKLTGYFAIRKREKKENKEHNKPFVQLLEGGVKTFNFLTNNNVVFVKTYNSKGNLTSYKLLSDNVKIDHNIASPSR